MAMCAKPLTLPLNQFTVFIRMRVMAGCTVTSGNGAMHIAVFQGNIIMALVTKLWFLKRKHTEGIAHMAEITSSFQVWGMIFHAGSGTVCARFG